MNNFKNTVAVLALLCASGMAYAQEATPAAPAPAPEVQNKANARRQEPCLKQTFLPSARLRAALQRPGPGNFYGSCGNDRNNRSSKAGQYG